MILNNPVPAAGFAQPRGMALVNGERVAGLKAFEVDNNSYFQADTFRLTLALSAQPVNRGFDFWAAQTTVQVELLAGFPGNPDNFTRTDLTSWLTGWADDIEVDPIADEVVLTGRDKTSLLVDTKKAIAFTNKRSSDIATQIATTMGLSADVDPTTKFPGTVSNTLMQMVNDRGTYWDVLTKLAQIEQYNVYVAGNTLFFKKAQAVKDQYVLRYQPPGPEAWAQVNAVSLRFSRNLSVARGTKVTVLSWNQKTGQALPPAVAQRARVKNATTAKSGSNGLPTAEYTFIFPNLTPQQAQDRANSLVQDISQHEVNVSADMPGDDLLTTNVAVKVVGTNSAFDQIYYPASIRRSYSWDEGYRMSLRARNFSPESQLS